MGWAQVWLGECKPLRKKVAIKIMELEHLTCELVHPFSLPSDVCACVMYRTLEATVVGSCLDECRIDSWGVLSISV